MTNLDADLACNRCSIPLTERQVQWADDTAYCADCFDWLGAWSEAQAEAAEERQAEKKGAEK